MRVTCRVGIAAVLLTCVAGGATPTGAASPQVTDAADDAYRIPETPLGQPDPRPSMPLLSNDAADILSASFATAHPGPGYQGAYRVSVTTAGTPNRGYNYIVGAQFGPDCWIFHYLTEGETRSALTRCGSGPVRPITGSRVVIGGDTISATFSFRRFSLPTPLKNDPVFGPLYVLTCPVTGKDWACRDDNVLDSAYSENTFEF